MTNASGVDNTEDRWPTSAVGRSILGLLVIVLALATGFAIGRISEAPPSSTAACDMTGDSLLGAANSLRDRGSASGEVPVFVSALCSDALRVWREQPNREIAIDVTSSGTASRIRISGATLAAPLVSGDLPLEQPAARRPCQRYPFRLLALLCIAGRIDFPQT